MALARARRDGGMNYWPGFVDVLSSFILGIIFLLTVFVFVQFYLTQEVTGKDTALNRLNAQIAQLTELLSLEDRQAEPRGAAQHVAVEPDGGGRRARPLQGPLRRGRGRRRRPRQGRRA